MYDNSVIVPVFGFIVLLNLLDIVKSLLVVSCDYDVVEFVRVSAVL